MALHHFPRIVTDGLVLCLDAANPLSYPGSGNTWYDLSGNNRNFILENNPVFNSTFFAFAGSSTNQRAVLSNAGMTFVNLTIEMGINILSNDGGYNGIFSGRLGSNNDYSNGFVLDLNSSSSLSFDRINIESQSNGLLNRDALVSDISFNTWTILSVTIDDAITNQYRIYINGLLNYNNSYNGSTIYLDNISLGQRFYGGAYQQASCLNGEISYLRIYNKALSANEVNQNYLATKGRYGL